MLQLIVRHPSPSHYTTSRVFLSSKETKTTIGICLLRAEGALRVQRSPASPCELTHGGGPVPLGPTVPGGMQEMAYSLGGSLKQDVCAVAKVAIAPHHPWGGKRGTADNDRHTRGPNMGAFVVLELLAAGTSLAGTSSCIYIKVEREGC